MVSDGSDAGLRDHMTQIRHIDWNHAIAADELTLLIIQLRRECMEFLAEMPIFLPNACRQKIGDMRQLTRPQDFADDPPATGGGLIPIAAARAAG